jgi:hypothetical protein
MDSPILVTGLPAEKRRPAAAISTPGHDCRGSPIAIGEQYGRLRRVGLDAVSVQQLASRDPS